MFAFSLNVKFRRDFPYHVSCKFLHNSEIRTVYSDIRLDIIMIILTWLVSCRRICGRDLATLTTPITEL